MRLQMRLEQEPMDKPDWMVELEGVVFRLAGTQLMISASLRETEEKKNIKSKHWQMTQGSYSANPGSAWEKLHDQHPEYPELLVMKEVTDAAIRLSAAVKYWFTEQDLKTQSIEEPVGLKKQRKETA